MDRSNMLFCPDLGNGLTRKEMAGFLAKKVFGDVGFSGLLETRYQQMGDLFSDVPYDDKRWDLGDPFSDCKNKSDPTKKDARLVVPRKRLIGAPPNVKQLFDYNNFGHDMPVWLVPRDVHDAMSRPRVMILSEDPLRDHDPAGNLYLSTPFGVHSYSFCEQVWNMETGYPLKIAEHIVCAGGIVLMTDFMKFFAYERLEGPQRGDDKNRLNPIHKNLKSVYRDLFQGYLRAEFERFRPNLVVTLGGIAAVELKRTFAVCMRDMKIDLDYKVKTKCVHLEKYKDMGDFSFKIITSYHPSSHGNDCTHVLCQNEPHTKQQYFNRLLQEIVKIIES